MVGVPTVRAALVVLSCGHTAWSRPDQELGHLVRCTACLPQKVDYGDGQVLQQRWVVLHLMTTDVPGIVEFVD
jgi:hypothetical protein